MSEFKNFESKEQREKFYQILRNFGSAFLFVGVLIFGGMFLMGVVGPRHHHFVCNAEQVVQKNKLDYFLQDGNYFSTGNAQSNKFSFNGNFSLKLNPDMPFGFGMDYEYLKGNEEVISWVWRYAEGDWISEGKIVASIDGKFWKAAEEVVERNEEGWEKIQFTFSVPNFSKNEILHLYCWNPGGKDIYFDDFHLVLKEKEEL